MKYTDLVQLFCERSNALETLWTIYITLVGALLAFCATRTKLGLWTMSIITAAFLLFTAANMSAMRDVTLQRIAVKDAISAYPTPKEGEEQASLPLIRPKLEPTLRKPSVPDVLTFHVICDGLTVSALWIISYRRNKQNARNPDGSKPSSDRMHVALPS
jgi:hypothetical protein